MSSDSHLSRMDIVWGIIYIFVIFLIMALITYWVYTFNKPTENFNRRGCDGSIIHLQEGDYKQDIYVPW